MEKVILKERGFVNVQSIRVAIASFPGSFPSVVAYNIGTVLLSC